MVFTIFLYIFRIYFSLYLVIIVTLIEMFFLMDDQFHHDRWLFFEELKEIWLFMQRVIDEFSCSILDD
jgi:hypothetical protein